MSFIDLVKSTRSCRRFEQKALPEGFLEYLIEIARICPSGMNMQPLKFITIDDKAFMDRLYPHLRWAGSLKDWDGPEPGERPTGYIAFVLDKTILSSAGQDTGIMAQTMQLAAMEKGIGSCMIGAYIKSEVEKTLELNDQQEIQLILALGYPKEVRVIVDVKKDEKPTYYRDADQVHYIPKRKTDDLIMRKI